MKSTTRHQSASQVNKDRFHTDRSLLHERDKTDESMVKSRAEIEKMTDRQVEKAREKADQNLKKHDKVTKEERAHTDSAISTERKKKKALQRQFFSEERIETNSRLAQERDYTDTETVRHEEQLTDEQQLHFTTKEALTTRNEFLAIVAHDLRNPVGAILSATDLLLEEIKPNERNGQLKWIEMIKRNAEVAYRLIGDLMDMERISEHKLEMQVANYDLNRIISEICDNFLRAAALKKVNLVVSQSKEPIFLVCDRVRISQVIANLLENALKFTPEGGKIFVEIESSDKEACVSVTDSGPGLSSENQTKIFGRFEQIHNKDRQGLGLGLYISRMLVQAHGGQIGVRSQLGQGSTFYFSLPVDQ